MKYQSLFILLLFNLVFFNACIPNFKNLQTEVFLVDNKSSQSTVKSTSLPRVISSVPSAPSSLNYQCNVGDSRVQASNINRLSRLQYLNSLMDLIGDSNLMRLPDRLYDTFGFRGELETIIQILPQDNAKIYQYKNLDQSLSIDHFFAYTIISSVVADKLSKNSWYFTNVSGHYCMKSIAENTKPPESCVRGYIKSFAGRALRFKVPLDYEDFLFLLYDTQATPQDGFAVMLQTILLDPRFLNMLEIDGTPQVGDEKLLALNDYEIAQRLSYRFLQTVPSQSLMEAASLGKLTASPESYQAEVEKILKPLAYPTSPNTFKNLFEVSQVALNPLERTYMNFYNEWLKIEDIPYVEPTDFISVIDREYGNDRYYANSNVSSGIKNSLIAETQNFVLRLTFSENKRYADLMNDRSSISEGNVRSFYNVPHPSVTYDYGHAKINFTDRTGLLTRAVVTFKDSLSDDTHPFLRGAFIRRNILCDPLASPKADALPDRSLSTDSSSLNTKRHIYESKVSGASCMGCHSQFNALGFALDDYDSMSRYRTFEPIVQSAVNSYNQLYYKVVRREPVNASVDDLKIDFISGESSRSGIEFSDIIAKSFKGNMCFVRQVFRHTMGRYEGQKDVCGLNELYTKMTVDSSGTIKKMILHIPHTKEFKMRRIGE